MASARDQPAVTESSDWKCRQIAAGQYGVIARVQAKDAGLSETAIAHRLRTGQWERLFQGVYATERTGDPWLRALMAACLKAKVAAVSHRAAGAIWKMDAIHPGRLEITIPYQAGGLRVDGCKVHRTRSMPPSDLTNRGPLPVTSVERTLLDLAGSVPPPELEAALDSALRKRLTNLVRVKSRLDLSIGCGLRGIAGLRKLIEDRMSGTSSMGSPLEVKFLSIVRHAKLPEPRRQVWIREGRRCIGRVDFAYPEIKLAIEIDSLEHHFGHQAMQNDRRRDRELQRLGWTILRFTAVDLDDAALVAACLRSFLTPGLFA